MARRPALSETSFLSHLFAPKNNAVPTGLRKRSVVATKGRSKARVKAFNKLSPVNQAALDSAGQREAYLRGESTLADAKRKLREAAVRLGVAKPVRPRVPVAVEKKSMGWETFHHLNNLNTRGKKNPRTIAKLVNRMSMDQRAKALAMERESEIIAAAMVKREDDDSDWVDIDGKEYNVFWYN